MQTFQQAETTLVHAGRKPCSFHGLVNTPVFRGSTIISPNLEAWEAAKEPDNPYASYGRFGTPTTRSFESAMASLEGGHRAVVFPSGLSACTHSLLAFLAPGDHVLLVDSVYGPTRAFAETVLKRLGVQVEYFAPAIGSEIRSLLRKNTRVVFVESPSSWTFEVQDVPAIAHEAHKVGAFVLMDNTWATPLFFKALDHGVDVSIQSATKYIIGHSDAILGAATANERAWPRLKQAAHDFGQTAGPDDIYLALRGIRTMSIRLRQHQSNALRLAEMVSSFKSVERVLHPALPKDPGHAIWKRDFLGASGVFSVALKPVGSEALRRFFDGFKLFGIGLSWGGFESLALPLETRPARSVSPWPYDGPLIRLSIGLENIEDLAEDLRLAFRRMDAARA